ncbi:MAG: hypothetical protein QME42_11920, partial [bacterium]|nr:hypothetical protein [bacterium]
TAATGTYNLKITMYDSAGNTKTTTETDAVILTWPDLWIEKQGPETATTGECVTYILTFGNKGSVTAYDVKVFDQLPSDFTLIGSLTEGISPATITLTSSLFTIHYSLFTSSTSGTITLWGTIVTNPSTWTLTNKASISTTIGSETTYANNEATTTITVIAGQAATITLNAPCTVNADNGTTTVYAYV